MSKPKKQKEQDQKGKEDKKPDEKPVPKWEVKNGKLTKLAREDFPKSPAGKVAWFDYMIAKWTNRKERYMLRNDPKAKAKRELDDLEAKKKKLLEQLKALG